MDTAVKRLAARSGWLIGLLSIPVLALAHHSFAMFDGKKLVTLHGAITDFQWTNPHTFIEIDVPTASGSVQHYSIECPSPALLKPLGWKRLSLKRGDEVTLSIYPLRDGRPGGILVEVTLPDGKRLDGLSKGYVK